MKKTLGIILLIIIIGLGAYLIVKNKKSSNSQNQSKQNQNQQANNFTADWKTYTNAQYGFEVKTPSDWSSETFGGTCVALRNSVNIIQICPGLPANIKTQDSLTANVSLLTNNIPGVVNEEKLSISNGSAYYGVTAGGDASPMPEAYLVGQHVILLMSYTSSNQSLEQQESLFKQMISTFKFTN